MEAQEQETKGLVLVSIQSLRELRSQPADPALVAFSCCDDESEDRLVFLYRKAA